MSETPVPPSRNGQARNLALVGVGLAIATQIPMTLSQIGDPTVRGLLMLFAAVVILWLGVRVR